MLDERFWSKVTKTDGCWLWDAQTVRGYGRFWFDGKSRAAHVLAWVAANGPVPDGMDLDHRCHSKACRLGEQCPHRRCVRPDHLLPVTGAVNTLRGTSVSAMNALKTECVNRHPFDDDNTRISPQTGERICRTCARDRQSRYKAKRSAA